MEDWGAPFTPDHGSAVFDVDHEPSLFDDTNGDAVLEVDHEPNLTRGARINGTFQLNRE